MNTTDVLINGLKTNQIESNDRGLLYGDGLFETIQVLDGKLIFWDQHLARLLNGCDRLKIHRPDVNVLFTEARTLCDGVEKGVLKLIYTRGCGGRGYRFTEKIEPTRILQRHSWPEHPEHYKTAGVRIRLCETRLGHNTILAGLKHLNRLEQVLGRSEWQDDVDIVEGLMADEQGNIIEGTMSNIFYVSDKTLITPDLSQCGIKGIIRELVIEYANVNNLQIVVKNVSLEELQNADEIFITNSIMGLWPVNAFNDRKYHVGPMSKKIAEHIDTLVTGSAGRAD